ncbi:hypothetical protein EYF80_020258 [Liparis tanakae]|uniref:Uncharacterized protein n=1 Tax=Liparis tanakae TaxID=230148 RepID=A0A4Z2HWN7_9TELE|nr:hypothetical protein EYF80_020258 [Liparis tanakae]
MVENERAPSGLPGGRRPNMCQEGPDIPVRGVLAAPLLFPLAVESGRHIQSNPIQEKHNW